MGNLWHTNCISTKISIKKMKLRPQKNKTKQSNDIGDDK